jgi:hypothetical protein
MKPREALHHKDPGAGKYTDRDGFKSFKSSNKPVIVLNGLNSLNFFTGRLRSDSDSQVKSLRRIMLTMLSTMAPKKADQKPST